jgi:hypothetical protein
MGAALLDCIAQVLVERFRKKALKTCLMIEKLA